MIWSMNVLTNEIMALAIILISTATNALHDRWIIRRKVGWWKWHIVKWIMFFPPLIFIAEYFVRWYFWGPLVIISWILWRSIYKGRFSFR